MPVADTEGQKLKNALVLSGGEGYIDFRIGERVPHWLGRGWVLVGESCPSQLRTFQGTEKMTRRRKVRGT
jgi:hypothetical protein